MVQGSNMKAERKAKKPRGASDQWGSAPFGLKRHVSPHGQVTAVSMMKDEGPFVIEWIAHHLAIGFTDLVVYTNDCSDGTDDMLIRLEELGLAHHRRNVIPEGLRPQPSALNHAQVEPVVCKSDWVMVFDADEFMSIRYGDGTLDELITAAKAQNANGIVVTWRIFGSGGVVDWSRAPVTEQYLYAAPPMWNKGWGVKTLFTFDPDHWKLGIHRPKMKNRHIDTPFPDTVKWLNGSGREMEDYFKFRGWRSITRTVGYDWVQLNHYAVKSVDSYAIRKMRGNVNNKKDKYNSDYWSLQDRNEVRDDTMLRYSDQRSAIMAELLQDPVLNRLHHAAIDRAEARLAELRQTEAYHQLVADLAKASAVPITQITAKPPQARDKEKIAALMSDVEKRRNAKAKEDRKAAPAEPKPIVTPMGSYVSGPIDLTAEVALDWRMNHTVEVPLDPRVFMPPALAVIETGKFERGIARRMPSVLPKGATVLDFGAGCGFLSAHLSRVRPDLTMVMVEDDSGLREALTQLCIHNGRHFSDRFRLLDDTLQSDLASGIRDLVTRVAPTSVIFAHPAPTPDIMMDVLATLNPMPEQIFLTGRWMEKWHADLDRIEHALHRSGWHGPQFGFDPVLTRGYGRKPAAKVPE